MRERQRDRQQGFDAAGTQDLETTAQDCQGCECVRLRTHERSLAAARKQLQVEATSPGEGGQVPDRQGHGCPDGRRHQGTQSRLPRLGLVNGHGEQAQGARIPPGTCRGQVGHQHLQECVEQTITFDEPLIDARFERARPAGRLLRAHRGRTVGGGQRHAAVAFLAQHPPRQLLTQLPIGTHEGQLQSGFEADERRQVPLIVVEGQVTVQFGQAQESDPLEPSTGDPGADVQVMGRGRALVDLEHARVDLIECPLAWVGLGPQVQSPKVRTFIQRGWPPERIRLLTH